MVIAGELLIVTAHCLFGVAMFLQATEHLLEP